MVALFVGQDVTADHTFPERDHFDGAYGLTLGAPIISPVIEIDRLQ
jgi:hypothetical protein